ncbi:hypothetical protein [Mycobacterium sp. OTB74]|uniref:hypothetical protein n=1 Tax=Mycobacterium sp. OTB74 TaxID=1853452 RepID=UPI00247668C7|nr:hypothetical protein [Mycobacterium sp. OTB74]MDH6245038.1 hypothetical protein [Mycobacterium sp. OTB74]
MTDSMSLPDFDAAADLAPVDYAPVDLDPPPVLYPVFDGLAPEPVRARTATPELATPVANSAARPQRVASELLVTDLAGDTALVVIKVTIDGWERHQLYVIDTTVWALVGIWTLYVESVQELLRWRRFLAGGGTLTHWLTTHPDGIQPDRSNV